MTIIHLLLRGSPLCCRRSSRKCNVHGGGLAWVPTRIYSGYQHFGMRSRSVSHPVTIITTIATMNSTCRSKHTQKYANRCIYTLELAALYHAPISHNPKRTSRCAREHSWKLTCPGQKRLLSIASYACLYRLDSTSASDTLFTRQVLELVQLLYFVPAKQHFVLCSFVTAFRAR